MRGKTAKMLRKVAKSNETPYKLIKKLYREALRNGTVAAIGKRGGLR